MAEKQDPDWMYKPILKTNTRTNYDGNEITQENIEEFERLHTED